MNMSKKKMDFPFSEEVTMMKQHFKQMIDEMPDEEFLDFILLLTADLEEFEDEDWNEDEGWEDEAEEFYRKNNIRNFPKFQDDDEDLPF